MFLYSIAEINVNPRNQIKNLGESASFICEYDSDSRVVWTFEGGKLPPNSKSLWMFNTKLNWLFLTSLQLNNAGTYACHDIEDYDHYDEGELLISGTNY